ncbi:coiled-coil alpha-helical rod protein 1 isoform X1 [Acanthochromis polyacanthus]|uniref:coiled-coil alpha-helical rod protein 1 isoform X1 n=1 Tax=Acanthochromis polyacanthus TaxID=80966 RepID=UPI002234B25F|nr:coiled-coil alpha-helical rod protein 1 isoform X1 [Acanthochromis polyacanthus]
MERLTLGKERLVAPTDFTSPAVPRTFQEDLVPPSHFASSVQSSAAHRGVQIPAATPPICWVNSGVTSVSSVDPAPANPWLAITQAQQEILELKRENQRILMLQGGTIRSGISADHLSDIRARSIERGEQWSKWESDWRLEAEKYKAEAERLKGQVEALKETAGRYRDEMRETDTSLKRNSHELEAVHEELTKTKTELSQIREELNLSSAQKKEISSQLERLKADSGEEITKLRRGVERSKEESQELALKAEMSKLQAEEEHRQQTLRLLEQLEEMQKKQDTELQRLNASQCAELGEARNTNRELQDRLQSMTSEVLQLKSNLKEACTERDGLKEHLSQMGQAFETQSATLHSLRNYIGQLAPEKGEKERLNEVVERLNKEKAVLQTTAELLTVRFNSINEILALQEEKMVKKSLTDPLVKNGSEGLQVLQLWREKVFKLCVQLRLKDIELRREKDKLLSKVKSTEQQLQQEQHSASVLQHSLHDRIAELDLERVEKETLKLDLAKVHKENAYLKSQTQRAEGELKTLTEAVHRFNQGFESKVAEVDAAKAKLNTFTQRLTFAKRRVETIQGLLMRRAALQKVEQACKQGEQAAESIRNLEMEHSLVCEERDRLTQELKRTPELIEKALANLKEQYEGKARQQQQELQQSLVEVQQAVADREKAEQSLQQIQGQLEERNVSLEKLRRELLSQEEQSKQALKERVSEIEDQYAEKLREMAVQVNTARREHTKAVMTLRQFEREATRKQDERKETQRLESENKKRDLLKKQLKETEMDKSFLQVTADERGLIREYTRAHRTAVPRKQNSSERSCSTGAKVQLPADERLLCVLEELHTLSAAVANSSEDSAEEEGQSDSVGPSTGSLHS